MNVECHNLNALARVISRTGTATFDFCLGLPYHDPQEEEIQLFVDSVDGSWLSRCRSFILEAPQSPWRVPDSGALGNLLKQYSYNSLEHIQVESSDRKMWEHMLESMMYRVEETSLNLRSLEITFGNESTGINKSILQRTRVLERIRSLNLFLVNQSISWTDFPNLERLEISYSRAIDTSNINELTAPGLTHLTLHEHFWGHNLPREVFPQLQHLTLNYFTYDEDMEPLALPNLLSLAFFRTNIDLEFFEAPKLEELVFKVDPYDEGCYEYPLLADATFSPRVLRLDIIPSSDDAELGEPLYLWRRMEELHLTAFEEDSLAETSLLEAISGETKEGCFPALRVLTILYPSGETSQGPSQETKERTMGEARAILKARLVAGLKPLEQLRVGWYWTNDDDNVLEDSSREWWVTMWEDCLEG